MYQTTVIGCDAVYCSGDCDGWTDFLFGTDHCKSLQTAFSDLSSQSSYFGISIFRNGDSGGRTAFGRAGLFLYRSGECVYYRVWRNLFSVSAAERKEGKLDNDCRGIDKNI